MTVFYLIQKHGVSMAPIIFHTLQFPVQYIKKSRAGSASYIASIKPDATKRRSYSPAVQVLRVSGISPDGCECILTVHLNTVLHWTA